MLQNAEDSGSKILTTVVLPDTLCEIESHAFDHCYSLLSIVAPATMKATIKSQAFSTCAMIHNIVIPKNCTIAEKAFGHGFLGSFSRVEIENGLGFGQNWLKSRYSNFAT